MTLDEFFEELTNLPVTWKLIGSTVRSEKYTPLELLCYSKGGTISWIGGRLFRPDLLVYFFQHGEILGLSEPDTHAIFRVSDNAIIPGSQGFTLRDYEIRKQLFTACRLKEDVNKIQPKKRREM